MQQLRRVVPFVERLALLHAVIALQANHLTRQNLGQRLRQRGLAHARLALQQQRALELERQKHGRGQPAIGKIAHALQVLQQSIDRQAGHIHFTIHS